MIFPFLILAGIIFAVVYVEQHAKAALLGQQPGTPGAPVDSVIVNSSGQQQLTTTSAVEVTTYLTNKRVTVAFNAPALNFDFGTGDGTSRTARIMDPSEPAGSPSDEASAPYFMAVHGAQGQKILVHTSGPYIAAVPADQLSAWTFHGSPWAILA